MTTTDIAELLVQSLADDLVHAVDRFVSTHLQPTTITVQCTISGISGEPAGVHDLPEDLSTSIELVTQCRLDIDLNYPGRTTSPRYPDVAVRLGSNERAARNEYIRAARWGVRNQTIEQED